MIIGDGLAGLATAYYLPAGTFDIHLVPFIREDQRVAWHEAHESPSVPSEATSARQHFLPLLVLGHHRETWTLLAQLHGHDSFPPYASVQLEFLTPSQPPTAFRPLSVPSPIHTLLGILRFEALSLSDRWRLLAHLEGLWEGAEEDTTDLDYHTADRWVASWEQSSAASSHVWDPLCRFLLGDPLSMASAASFKCALKQFFFASRHHELITVFAGTRRSQLLTPLEQRLRNGGITWHQQPVSHLTDNGRQLTGAVLRNGQTLTADQYVVALPPHALLSLLSEHLLSRFSSFEQLHDIVVRPITILAFRLAHRSPHPRLLLGPPPFLYTLWIPTTEGTREETTIYGTVLQDDVASCSLEAWVRATLTMPCLSSALGDTDLDWSLKEWEVIHKAWPSYSSRPGFSAIRPLQRSPIENLSIAGGWTDTNLPPSSLESELISAKLCAEVVMNHARHRVDTAGYEI